MKFAAAFFVLVFDLFFSSSMAEASTCTACAVGRIEFVVPPGSVTVRSKGADTGDKVASYPHLLFGGDVFVFSDNHPEAVLEATINGERKRYTSLDLDKSVPERKIEPTSEVSEKLMAPFAPFLAHSRKAIPVFAMARDVRKGAPVTLEYDPHFQENVQYVPARINFLALVWRGGAADFFVTLDDVRRIELKSGRYNWIVFSPEKFSRGLHIKAINQSLAWTVKINNDVPSPPWFGSNTDDTLPLNRLVRAVWLLEHSSDMSKWQLFALSEIYALSKDGIFFADQLWQAIRSGEEISAL